MKLFIYVLFTSFLLCQNNFEDYFEPKTLRFDYLHCGDKQSSLYFFDKMIEEEFWSGSRKNLIDETGFGDYFFTITDSASNKIIYSRGYSTLFYEWQTTTEAGKISKAMRESLVFPYPKKSCYLDIYERGSLNNFFSVFKHKINPYDYFIEKSRNEKCEIVKLHYSGDYSEKYDIVFLPEGYTETEIDKFIKDSEPLVEYLLDFEPFKELSDKINIWAVKAYSKDTGADIPKDSVWKETLMDFTYYTFDSERYLMTENFHKVRDLASCVPYDNIYVIVNTDKYGGGAIYNFYSVLAAGNPRSKQVFIHELGHGLAGLADEYYDSQVSYEEFFKPGIEPWQPNITTLTDFSKKWENSIDKCVPVPTPADDKYFDKLGVFEGGGYVSKGVYRPANNSIMKELKAEYFNLPSIIAIKNIIKSYSE